MKKSILVILALFVTATTIVACDKKKDGGKTNRVFRNSDYRDNNYRRNGGSSEQGTWGVIYNNSQSMTNVLNDFMGGISDLGFVSGRMNDPSGTGVRFRGQVTGNSGEIGILVWDEIANNGDEPIYWTMRVVSSRQNGGSAQVVIEDELGSVTFDGTFSGSEYRGRVNYSNGGGQGGSLGQFAIGRCALFDCY